MIIQYDIKFELYLNIFNNHTIYTKKFQKMNLIFIFVITKKLKRQKFNEIIVFIDN